MWDPLWQDQWKHTVRLLVMQMSSHLSHCLPLSVLRSSHVSSSSFAAISISRLAPTLQSCCGDLHKAWPRGTACRIRALHYISPGLLENAANFSFQGWVYLPQTPLVQSMSLLTESMGDRSSQGVLSCQRGQHSEVVLLKRYLSQVDRSSGKEQENGRESLGRAALQAKA